LAELLKIHFEGGKIKYTNSKGELLSIVIPFISCLSDKYVFTYIDR